jgi:hypothetical protein
VIEFAKVVGLKILVVCHHCKGERRVSRDPDRNRELVNCPCCNGSGVESQTITVDELRQCLEKCP